MRIINLPEETQLRDDDYVVIESEDGGTVKIPVKDLVRTQEG